MPETIAESRSLVAVVAVLALAVLWLIRASRIRARGRREAEQETKWRDSEAQKTRERDEVEQSTDLAYLARQSESSDPVLCTAALAQLLKTLEIQDPLLTGVTDQAVLAIVATTIHSPLPLRLEAIGRIRDQTVLADIVSRPTNNAVEARRAAAEAIDDGAVRTALTDTLLRRLDHSWSREDQEITDHISVINVLIGKITQRSFLREIILREDRYRTIAVPEPCVVAAVRQIDDQALFRRICQDYGPRVSLGETESPVCEAVLARITDEKLLLEAAEAADLGGGTRHLRLVRRRITDPSVRAELDEAVRSSNRRAADWTESP